MKNVILGVDPGTRLTGYGIIRVDGDRLEHLDHGVIRLNEKLSLPERLQILHTELRGLYARQSCAVTVVEKIFFGKNADSAFKLGHARGVCLMAAAEAGSTVEEYAARYVKKCVTGSGAASKDHVQMVVFNLLRIQPRELALDASDALALAVTHARLFEVSARMKRALEGAP